MQTAAIDTTVNELNIPTIITQEQTGPDLFEWFSNNKELIEHQILEDGPLLFRGYKINGSKAFEKLIASLGSELLDYNNRSTPRTLVKGQIYTSTEYPPNEHIALHNENSYTNSWARLIAFFCMKAAEEGGETPIADSRRIYQMIPAEIREEFEAKKVMYVRNYGHIDLSWQEVFQTDAPAEVEAYCKTNNIEFSWNGERLKTWQVCQSVAVHPVTGEKTWFNQAHLFHMSNLAPEIRNSLLSSMQESELPRNACYGDGSAIDPSFLEEIRKVYQQEEVVFSWQSGDVLLMDNMLFAHGRKPFKGSRKVFVGMTD